MIFIILYALNISAWVVVFQELQNTDQTTTNLPWYIKGQDVQAFIFYQCERQLIALISEQEIYRAFSVTQNDVTQIKFEADIYFSFFEDSEVIITVNDKEIYHEQFYKSQIELYSNLCVDLVGNHYFTTIEIIFDFEVLAQNYISIKFNSLIQSQSSYFGIRNINLYSDGIYMSCPSKTPILSSSLACIDTCDSTAQQLTSPQLTTCMTPIPSTNVFQRIYPSSSSDLITYQIADGVWLSDKFKQTNIEQKKQIIISTFTHGITNAKLQLQGIIYLIGDWKDGSYLRLQLNSTSDSTTIKNIPKQEESQKFTSSITNQFKYTFLNESTDTITCTADACQQKTYNISYFKNELITINKTNSKFVANPSNFFNVYQTQLTLINGTKIPVQKIILNTENMIPQTAQTLTFSIEQNLIGDDALYAFQNRIYLYQATKLDIGCSTLSLQACVKCKIPYYVHLGQCVEKCPIHSKAQTQTSIRNCTDYINIETLQYTSNISQNSSGVYLIKEFYGQINLLNKYSKFKYCLLLEKLVNYYFQNIVKMLKERRLNFNQKD